MKRLFCLFFAFFYFHVFFAQTQAVFDGQTRRAEAAIDKKLNEIAAGSIKDPQQKEDLLFRLKAQSEKLGYDSGIFQSGDYLMNLYLNQSRNKETVELGNQLKKAAKNKKDAYGFITSIYRRNALALGYLGLNDASIKDFKTAIKYAETIKDKDKRLYLLGQCYENITVYFINKRFENKIYRDSIVCYLNKSIDAGKYIRDDSKSVSNTLKYDQIAFGNMRLGIFYLEQADKEGSLELAEKYLLEGLKIYENKKYHIIPDNKIMMLNQISWLYMEKKDYQKSIDFAKRAMALEKQYFDPYHRVESFEFLATSYLETGEKEKSKFYMGKYTALKDSLNYADKKDADVTMKNMVAEVKENHEENSKRQLVLILILVIVAIMATLFFWRRRNKILHEKYEQIINRLRNESVDDTIIINNKFTVVNHKNNISSETEVKLLKKIINFENSEKFIKKDITISFLSNQWDTNPKYLSEVIKKNRSQSFSNYINSLRINYIVYKLYNEPKYREYKISYLAETCGFGSSQVFVLAFKKVNGVTPSYFIQNLREEDVVLAY